MRDEFVKSVIEELGEEAFEAYTEYISFLLDFHTIDSRKIKRTDIYEIMDELCQLNKWSTFTMLPNCYAEQLMYYYESYARCDKKYASGNTIPAYVFWDRGIKSLKKFIESEQSFECIELLEDAVKIFLCIIREVYKNTSRKFLCKTVDFSIDEKDIETIITLRNKKTFGKYSGFRADTIKIFDVTLPYPIYEKDIVSKQRQQEKDYIYMVTTALYCRLMESEGFY